MAKPKKTVSKPENKNDLIKTVSEVEALSNKEKAAFRQAGGTTISNPTK
tara:strand:- start:413 stop:559 length:147 start_codon:yes stop_codon:yes gene_type:complete